MMTERSGAHIPPDPIVSLYGGQISALRRMVCVECLEAVSWKGRRGQASPSPLVEEPKKYDSEDDNYVEVVRPRMAISIVAIGGYWSRGCGGG
jgi:hypothetical protein